MQVDPGRTFLGRLPHGADLLEELTAVCRRENVRLGVFSVIGALRRAKFGYYDQRDHRYVDCLDLDKKLEITSCLGNISIKDDEVFVHMHATLADHQGTCYGGHVMPGSLIFAAEYYVKELTGMELVRQFHPETRLLLWP